ncbi:hypothetical protein [Rhodosalinus sp.]|uniref:hypothetical protein n=1 Tax=Rhodosalinus sp. TaxID=2047741 RepID=UPI00356A77AB
MRTTTLWLGSVLLSVIAIVFMVRLWSDEEPTDPGRFTRIDNRGDLAAFVDRQRDGARSRQFQGEAPRRVPTGVFIQSIGFVSASTVNVTGYLWQRYPPDYPYEKGITFPEEVNSGDTTIEEQFRQTVVRGADRHELIGWYFDVTLRQYFDHSRYPIDVLNVWLRLWSADFNNDENILLVPDFSGYADTDRPRFGLDQDIVSGEWSITESYFAYRDVPYDTLFGYDMATRATTEPIVHSELYFNLGVERKFISAFVINLVPLFVVALLLFAALMTMSRDENRSSRFGFTTAGFLGTCSALFFVVLLAHVQVRDAFAGSGLVYIEYFYLVMYLAILFSAINAYLFSLEPGSGNRPLLWRDNLVAKIAFWPVLSWSMLIISVVIL